MEHYPQFSDDDLIARCLDKDAAAWETLVLRYQRLITSITVKFGLSMADAADILQSVFIILYEQMGSLRQRTRLSSWLITVTVRECWKLRARRKDDLPLASEQWAEMAEHPDHVSPALEEELLALERQHLVRRALEQLPPQCRQILEQLFYQETPSSYAEISRRLGIPIASIGPTRGRCLEKLREKLSEVGFF